MTGFAPFVMNTLRSTALALPLAKERRSKSTPAAVILLIPMNFSQISNSGNRPAEPYQFEDGCTMRPMVRTGRPTRHLFACVLARRPMAAPCHNPRPCAFRLPCVLFARSMCVLPPSCPRTALRAAQFNLLPTVSQEVAGAGEENQTLVCSLGSCARSGSAMPAERCRTEFLLQCMSPEVARNCRSGMSAFTRRLGGKRTCLGHVKMTGRDQYRIRTGASWKTHSSSRSGYFAGAFWRKASKRCFASREYCSSPDPTPLTETPS